MKLDMNYFLAKTDPDTYSLDQFEKEKKTIWDGVHNYQAIKEIQKMQIGDVVFIYHSQTDRAIVGLARVVGEPFENKNDPRYSWAVKLEFMKRINPISLSAIKSEPIMKDFLLVRNPRLSTMGVPKSSAEWLMNLVNQQ